MIYVVVGPTGVGKTKLSVALAKRLNAEIINADSMQVYKGLDIGTAKVTKEEKEGVPHHLFDIVEPSDMYTVFDYQRDARNKIKEIESRGKNIIMVGGTGLYIRACLYDYKFQEETTSSSFDNLTNEKILEELKKYTDIVEVHPNNRKRLIRLLNRYIHGNVSNEKSEPIYDFKMIGLTTNRDNLYEKINKRVDIMVDNGLLEEVKTLHKKGIRSKAIDTGIGYKELYRYFDGLITKEEAIEEIKKNSRHYAKRQYTFFNNQFTVNWFETNYNDFQKTVDEVMKFLNK